MTIKTVKEIKVNNRVRTLLECTSCGATTYVNTGKDTKTAQTAIGRSCKVCSPPQNLPKVEGWWKQFGLKKNPGVYGPMPRLRTGHRYRMEEARRMGWMAWTWHDEFEEERKGIQAKPLTTQHQQVLNADILRPAT